MLSCQLTRSNAMRIGILNQWCECDTEVAVTPVQARNYERRKQQEAEREQLFEGALKKFNSKDIEGVRVRMTAAAAGMSEPCTCQLPEACSRTDISRPST